MQLYTSQAFIMGVWVGVAFPPPCISIAAQGHMSHVDALRIDILAQDGAPSASGSRLLPPASPVGGGGKGRIYFLSAEPSARRTARVVGSSLPVPQ